MKQYTRIVLTLILAARRKRKIFRIRGLPERFQELAGAALERDGYHMRTCRFCDFFVIVELDLPFTASASDAAFCIRTATSVPLRTEFKELALAPSLLERTCFAASGTITENSDMVGRFYAAARGTRKRKEGKMFTEEMVRSYLSSAPRYEKCERHGYVTYFVYVGDHNEFVDGFKDSAYMIYCDCPVDSTGGDILTAARRQEAVNAPPFMKTVAELTRQLNQVVYGISPVGLPGVPDAAITLCGNT